jgi:hypothetical protein
VKEDSGGKNFSIAALFGLDLESGFPNSHDV